jgi:cellulose synthase/poly-beta-1,6-N-acetylglucosamine synthase-like glycosyltransferase
MAGFMIAADIYDVKFFKKFKNHRVKQWPKFTILIPAYNEELTIEKTVRSVLAAKYPSKEIIVIDDGSKDGTSAKVKALKKRFWRSNLRLIRQKNAGKGAALNNGIAKAKGELVMVLDADSAIRADALKNSVKYFEDKRVKAVASSVSLDYNHSWLGLLQKVEYLLSYRMKRSQTQLNTEYIIGGAGSIYRLSTLKQVNGYRHNTMTEDIDLSMKVVARGNKANRVIFASDVKASTEPVHSLKELISQRFRWKFGRLQVFVRYRQLFLSRQNKHSKMFSWFQLPYAVFGELYLLAEPLLIGIILYVYFVYGDSQSVARAMGILTMFIVLNIIMSEDETWKDKLTLVYLTPVIIILLPVLTYVELSALFKSLKNWRMLSPKTKQKGSWQHVKRAPSTT